MPTDLKRLERDLDRFRLRLVAAGAFVVLCFGLLVARLVWLQVVRYEDLAGRAEANRIAVTPIVPNRGLIIDRNGVPLATNYSAYALEIVPARMQGDLEAVIDALSQVVEITPRDRRRFRRLMDDGKGFESVPIRNRLSDEEVARFTAQRYRFPGVEVQARLFRSYPQGDVGAHAIGYLGRINAREKKLMEDWDDDDQANYRGTDVMGKQGLEERYERELHGSTGFEQFEISASGRAVRRLGSQPATPGKNLVLALDIKLQWLVEQLYGDRRGALVAIDPRNGQVLAFVSMPTYDPNLFVDGIDHESWKELNESLDKPLINRPLRGLYPPASTYKPFMSLASLRAGFRTPQQGMWDPGYFNFGNNRFRDDKPGGHGWVDLYRAVVQSCDTYYYVLASEMGVDRIAEQMAPFGFGQITGIDLVGEARGVLPTMDWKARTFKKPGQGRWIAGETISLGIGQGYNSFTILQMAQATAVLASGGQRWKPHLVKEVADVVANQRELVEATPLEPTPIKPEHLAAVRRALVGVNREGTSAGSFAGASYQAAGKTGTAQVFSLRGQKYNASRISEYLRDHALYMAYAPAENPTVAVALVVENAGFGAQSAAPIARRVLDYVVSGLWPSEADLAATSRGQTTAPIGQQRRVQDILLPSQVAANAASASAAASAAAPQRLAATTRLAPTAARSARPSPAPVAHAATAPTAALMQNADTAP